MNKVSGFRHLQKEPQKLVIKQKSYIRIERKNANLENSKTTNLKQKAPLWSSQLGG